MSIIGKKYFPKDNSYIGMYINDKFVDGGQLCSTGEVISSGSFGFEQREIIPLECTIKSEPFPESIRFLGNSHDCVFVKVEHDGMLYRVLWNPTWVRQSSSKSIDLSSMSEDELANIIIDAQKILSSK